MWRGTTLIDDCIAPDRIGDPRIRPTHVEAEVGTSHLYSIIVLERDILRDLDTGANSRCYLWVTKYRKHQVMAVSGWQVTWGGVRLASNMGGGGTWGGGGGGGNSRLHLSQSHAHSRSIHYQGIEPPDTLFHVCVDFTCFIMGDLYCSVEPSKVPGLSHHSNEKIYA